MDVDEETAQIVRELLPQFRAWQIEEYILLSSFSALTYYYVTTLHEEVAHIWSEKRKAGKTLFLMTRYLTVLTMVFVLLTNWRTHSIYSVSACQAVVYIQNILAESCRTTAEATLWLCLYALLGGTREYFWALVLAFMSLTIPIIVLELYNALSQKAIERSILDDLLGYPCNYAPVQHPSYEVIASYIILVRTALALLAGLVVIVKRYQSQNHDLIKVIKREGGFYYMSALVFRFLVSISATPGSKIKDQYGIFYAFRWVLIFIFVDRLLLQMRKVNDPGTRATISTLIFERPERGNSAEEDEANENVQ